jgi:hypothetical protein
LAAVASVERSIRNLAHAMAQEAEAQNTSEGRAGGWHIWRRIRRVC